MKIKPGIRDKRSKRHEKIQAIIEDFKGLRTVASIKTRNERVLITHMRQSWEALKQREKGIANVFA